MITSKKKILHLITGLEVGGAETMLLKTLPTTKAAVDHFVCSITGVGPIGDKLTAGGIPVYHLDLTHALDLTIIPRLRHLINKINPDVLITYLPHADILGRVIGRSAGVPTIVASIRVRLTRSKYLPFFLLDGATSPFIDRYHFNSRTIADIHRRLLHISPQKITVIPNAIDVSKYNITVDVEEKREELNIPRGKLVLGCVARLRKQKGYPYLVAAFADLHKKRADTVLVVVGDGEEKKRIMHEITRRGLNEHVLMLGNRHDIAQILQVFDIYVLTTLYEGMSNSIMEAMAAKRAIVTTNIPENRELISDGKTGLLVPARNAPATSQALVKLIDNPDIRDNLARAAYAQVVANFNLDVIIPKYRRFYESL